jgi:hypothetical protein
MIGGQADIDVLMTGEGECGPMPLVWLCRRLFSTALVLGLCSLGGLLISFASAAEPVRPATKATAPIPDGNAIVSGNGADTSRLSTEQKGKAWKELDAWLDGQGRWDKREARPGEWIDKLPSIPPPIKRIEPPLDAVALHGDGALLEQHWPEFLKRHPMTAKQLEKSGMLALPNYDAMPGMDFPAFKQRLVADLAKAFENQPPELCRQKVLGILVWTAAYADLLAARGDEKARRDAGELMHLLSRWLVRFHNPALAKDMPLAPCLAFEIVWPGLTLCPVDDPQKKESLVYAVDRAFQIGWGLQVPAATKYEWGQVQLALCKWRLEARISRHDAELAARDLAYAYAAAGDHGRAIQYYHLATQINLNSSRNYAGIIKALLLKKYPKPQAEQQSLAYLKLLSRGELASKGGGKAILQRRAEECKAKGDFAQATAFLKTMDPHGWDPGTRKEISELEKKRQDKNPGNSDTSRH